MTQIDYFVSSESFEPKLALQRYTEQLVRFDSIASVLRPEGQVAPSVVATIWERMFKSLPAGARVYMCAQMLSKIHPRYDAVIRGILQRDPLAYLPFFNSLGGGEGPRVLYSRWLKDPVLADAVRAGRLVIFPKTPFKRFHALLQGADVLLDTFPIMGGVTSFETFGFCTPLVTFPRATPTIRFTLGFYNIMGNPCPDCIVDSVEEYVSQAVRLASNKTFNQEMRQAICDGHPRLFNRPEGAVEWNSFLLRIMKNYVAQ